ncbi:hypothetical protein ACFUEN_15665 [Streptomyces griseorubiginosus]
MFNRAATRPPQWRMRYRISALAAFLAAVAVVLTQAVVSTSPARAAGFYDCPRGFGNGSSCSNIDNTDTVNQRRLPEYVYRGDSRAPYEIFTNGFRSVGTDYDIQRHVQGGNNARSGYISTSAALSESESFARSQGGRNLDSMAAQPSCRLGRPIAVWSTIPGLGGWRTSDCDGGWVEADTFVYLIDAGMAHNALYIPDQVRGNTTLARYASQEEWAYVRRIPNTAVAGVRIYRMRARVTNGVIDFRTQTFRFDRYVGNPHHAEARSTYDPSADPGAHFNRGTYLDVPAINANPYTRGCEEMFRCRGGDDHG